MKSFNVGLEKIWRHGAVARWREMPYQELILCICFSQTHLKVDYFLDYHTKFVLSLEFKLFNRLGSKFICNKLNFN